MIGFLSLIPNSLKFAAGAALAIVAAWYAGNWNGARVEASAAEARAVKATLEQLKERGLIDEAVQTVSDCDLLVELGGLRDDCGE